MVLQCGWIGVEVFSFLQVLGALYPQVERKGQAAAAHFRSAAANTTSAEVWEMLADLLAAADPSGAPYIPFLFFITFSFYQMLADLLAAADPSGAPFLFFFLQFSKFFFVKEKTIHRPLGALIALFLHQGSCMF